MLPTTHNPRDTDGTAPDDGGLADYLPLAILVYAAVGLAVATLRMDPDQMFGLGHLLGFIGSILAWPLVIAGLV